MLSAGVLSCILLLLNLTYHTIATSPNGVSGFPDKGLLTARASQLHSLTTHHNQTRIFPDFNFSCQGHITGITLLGQENAPPHLMGPGVYLQLWQLISSPTGEPPDPPSSPPDEDVCTQYRLVLEETVDNRQRPIVRGTRIVNLKKYEFDISTSPIDVMEGWVMGIRQSPASQSYVSLYYQEGGGPQPYSNGSCIVPLDDNDYPLIAVKFTSSDGYVNPPGCVHGILTLSDIMRVASSQYLSTDVEPMQPTELRLFLPAPRPIFSCGGYVISWTVAVQIGEKDSDPSPELQIWRLTDGEYQKQDYVNVTRDTLIPTAQNVYEVIGSFMRFESGDFFGLYQPPNTSDQFSVTTFHYVRSDQWNFVTFSDTTQTSLEAGILVAPLCADTSLSRCTTPLVTATVVCDPGCNGGCLQGFLDKSELLALAELIGDISYASNQSYLFPDVGFTSAGIVTGWEFAALSAPLSSENTQLPHIEIWRPMPYPELGFYQVYSTSYFPVHFEKADSYNVYRYILDPPMVVEAGDVIGISQPPAHLSQVSLALLRGTEPLFFPEWRATWEAEDQTRTLLPLIVPQFLLLNVSSTSVPSLTPPSSPTSPTPPPSTDKTTADFPLGAVVGGSLGGVVAVAILTAVVLLLVCFQRSRTKSGLRAKNNHLVNSRGYPDSPTSPNTADTDTHDSTGLSAYNEVYDTSIAVAGNIAYNSHMTLNVAYRATVGHSVPHHTTNDISGSYVIDQLEYKDRPHDMEYDYIQVLQ